MNGIRRIEHRVCAPHAGYEPSAGMWCTYTVFYSSYAIHEGRPRKLNVLRRPDRLSSESPTRSLFSCRMLHSCHAVSLTSLENFSLMLVVRELEFWLLKYQAAILS
jgi:hypothetical protein